MLVAGALAFGVAACGTTTRRPRQRRHAATEPRREDRRQDSRAGSIRIDGSSTVQPLAEAAAELFQERGARTSRSPSAAPAPATASSASAAASSTIADASRAIEADEYRGLREGEHRARSRSRSASTACPSSPTRISRSRTTASRPTQLKKLLDPKSKVANYSELGDGLPRPEGLVLHAGHRVGHVRLLHRGGPRDRRRAAHEGRPDLGRRQPDRHRHRGHRGRAGLRRLRVRRREQGQAEDPRGRRRRRLRQARRSRRSPTAATRRCRARCSCTRATETVKKPEVKGFIEFILDNNEEVNEAADYVPLTDELKTEAKANLDGATPVEAPAE